MELDDDEGDAIAVQTLAGELWAEFVELVEAADEFQAEAVPGGIVRAAHNQRRVGNVAGDGGAPAAQILNLLG